MNYIFTNRNSMALKLSGSQEEGIMISECKLMLEFLIRHLGELLPAQPHIVTENSIPVQAQPAEIWVEQNAWIKNVGKRGNTKTGRCLHPERLT